MFIYCVINYIILSHIIIYKHELIYVTGHIPRCNIIGIGITIYIYINILKPYFNIFV